MNGRDGNEAFQELLEQFREWEEDQTLPSSGLTESGWAYKRCGDALEQAMDDDDADGAEAVRGVGLVDADAGP